MERFFPIFLHKPQRQKNDLTFYNLLQELVGLRQSADSINDLLCKNHPLDNESPSPIISLLIDTLNHSTLSFDQQKTFHFNRHTNLPEKITLQEGARIMFLNNKLFEHEICNGTVGIITKLIDSQNIEATFPTSSSITKIIIQKETSYFTINGNPASRRQFPIQNAFSLTIHKTQGLTLPHATVSIDQGIFAPGQAYVAMSRATSWDTLDILSFDFSSVKTDPSVITEYARLSELNRKGLNSIL